MERPPGTLESPRESHGIAARVIEHDVSLVEARDLMHESEVPWMVVGRSGVVIGIIERGDLDDSRLRPGRDPAELQVASLVRPGPRVVWLDAAKA